MWTLLLVLSCTKEVPPHLQVEPRVPTENLAPSMEALLGSDPLARRPDPREPEAWTGLNEAEVLRIWSTVAATQAPTPADWVALEARTRGTVGVALARGAMLAGLEVSQGDWGHPHQKVVAAWLGLTRVDARPLGGRHSAPLDWLPGTDPQTQLKNARHIAVRRVLTGWLDGPDIDLNAVGKAIQSDSYTSLIASPTGALIDARARDQRKPSDQAEGRDLLWAATAHAARWAGADSNKQQAILRQERDTSRKAHGATPTTLALRAARAALEQDAGDAESAGLALVAITAERIIGTCPDIPCEGLGRVATLQRAALWGEDARVAALLWTIIATKQALDTLEVALDHPSLYRRLPEVADALSGLTQSPIALSFLRHRTSSPALYMALSRMADGPDITEKEDALDAIRRRLITLCDQVPQTGVIEAIRDPVQRICHRTASALAKG